MIILRWLFGLICFFFLVGLVWAFLPVFIFGFIIWACWRATHPRRTTA